MTENDNPKPFNISRQKCQRHKLGKTALLGLSVSQSIHLPSNQPNRIQIKDYQKFNRFVNPLFVIIKQWLSLVGLMTKMTDQIWK